MFKNLVVRLVIIFTLVSAILFALIATYLYYQGEELIIGNIEKSFVKEVDDLATLVKMQEKRSEEDLNYKLKVLTFQIYRQPFFEGKEVEQIAVTDIYSGQENVAAVHKWYYRGKPIDQDVIREFNIYTNSYIAILQKFEDGYVVTGTDFPQFTTKGLTFYFPKSTNVSIYLDAKETYIGQVELFGKLYRVGILPIIIDGEVKGGLMVIMPVWYSSDFTGFFTSKVYLEKGYPVLLSDDGVALLHPHLKGMNLKNTNIFYRIYSNRKPYEVVKLEYRWPENAMGKEKIMYYEYLPDLKFYVAVIIFKEDLAVYTKVLKKNYLLSVIFATIFSFLLLYLMNYFILRRMDNLREFTSKLAMGILPDRKLTAEDTVAALQTELDLIKFVENIRQVGKTIEALYEENYDYKYEPVSEEDQLGHALVRLQQKLKEKKDEELSRKREEEIRAWRNRGIEKFIGILSLRGEDINKWAFNILSNLIDYLDAIMGGFFLLETDEHTGEEYLELVSCYAFQEKRQVKRRIPIDVGLYARVVKEKQIIYVDDVPDNYQPIATALLEVKPKTLVLLPLLFLDEVVGVIEIGSLNKFEDYKLEFLEEVAHYIISSISSWRISRESEKMKERYMNLTREVKDREEILEKQVEELKKVANQYDNLFIEHKQILRVFDHFLLYIEMDEKGKVLNVNKKVLETFNRPESFFVDKFLHRFSNFDLSVEEYRKMWEDVLAGKIIKNTENIKLQGDRNIWLTEYFVAVHDRENNVRKVIVLATDITELKMLEKQLRIQVKEISKETRQLRREERKLRKEKEQFEKERKRYVRMLSVYDSVIITAVLNKEAKFVSVNKMFEETLGYPLAELENIPIFEIIISTDRGLIENEWDNILEGFKFVEKITYIRKTGDSLALKTYFFAYEDEETGEKQVMVIMTF